MKRNTIVAFVGRPGALLLLIIALVATAHIAGSVYAQPNGSDLPRWRPASWRRLMLALFRPVIRRRARLRNRENRRHDPILFLSPSIRSG